MKARFAFALFASPCLTALAATPPHLMLETIDGQTGKHIPCLIRITDDKERIQQPPGLLNRGTGLRKNHPAMQWACFPGSEGIKGIYGSLRVEAFAGPEYEMATGNVQTHVGHGAYMKLKLKRITNPHATGWRSGNTHLHLMNLTRQQADNYLRTVPRSDGLELVFVSNLRRAKAELEYITNEHRAADLKKLESADLRFGWGEEHRHNYGPGGQGYGHVMLLNIKKLVRPVSIGSGIMLKGTDDPPLQRGIREARGQGATVVWCHNSFGLEDIPNWFGGTVDAQNIFDGGSHDSYDKTYYRYLNVGLRVPFSTGTDWFMYDFSRVYVRVNSELTPKSWLAALRKGRSYISNGPLLKLRCGKNDIGDVIATDKRDKLTFRGHGLGRNDFRRLQLVYNGKVVKEAASRKMGGHFAADVEWTLETDSPGWVALRVDSGFATLPANAPVAVKGEGVNEFGQGLFGHTSPIYIDYAGKRVFRLKTARGLIKEMEAAVDEILKRSKFTGDLGKMQVMRVYEEGIRALERKLAMSE